jgi:hypothetical protein
MSDVEVKSLAVISKRPEVPHAFKTETDRGAGE